MFLTLSQLGQYIGFKSWDVNKSFLHSSFHTNTKPLTIVSHLHLNQENVGSSYGISQDINSTSNHGSISYLVTKLPDIDKLG